VPGVFSKSARPTRPGTYVNWESVDVTTVPASIGSTVAVAFTHDWGPSETAVLVESLGEFKAVFGPSENTPGFAAVKQAFQGEGLDGRGGAGAVVAFRMVGAAGAKATKVLSNTTPAPALTLTAKGDGSYGNRITVTVQDNASNPANSDLIILVDGSEAERFTYPDAGIQNLVDQINAGSGWVTATATVTTVALGVVANQSFASGADGGTLLAADYTAAMSALEHARFAALAFENLTDATIVTSLKTWSENLNRNGKRFMTVIGGLANETITTAVTRAAAAASENIITLGMGSVQDAQLGVLSSAQLAPRIAGILAAKGEAQSMTFARVAGVSILFGASEAEINQAFDAGVMVLSRDSNPDAPVRIEKALTTYTSKSNADKPYLVFRDPKNIRTMQGFEMEMAEWSDSNIIGRTAVNDKTRDFVVGETRSRAQKRADLGVIQPGFTVMVDPDPAPTDSDNFIAIMVGFAFGRSVEQVFFTIQVS
jgi:putative intracellular protease/amidase